MEVGSTVNSSSSVGLECSESIIIISFLQKVRVANNSYSKKGLHIKFLHIKCVIIGETLDHEEGSLRFVNSSSTSDTVLGSLEVYAFGVWLSVCGASFTDEAATVACYQLGYAGALSHCTDSW